MINRLVKVNDILAKNRAEELDYDVWNHFVVPPFYDALDLTTARKPRIIEGGRGCGKTILLRYLSHQSMFSPNREYVPEDAFSHIGLYWRADTQFCNAMIKRNVSEEVWGSAFNHFAALIISMEILNSLTSISKSKFASIDPEQFQNINFSRLSAFDENLPSDRECLFNKLEDYLWEFESWVNDVKIKEPRFLPGKGFILAMIKMIKTQIPILEQAIFYVYLDEYENLTKYQQRIINTWVKHSESPLIINLAMKKNAFVNRETLGTELLSNINDYRVHDLEEYLNRDDNFQVLAAEILALQLSSSMEFPINIKTITDPSYLMDRKDEKYRLKIVQSVQKLFPDTTQEEIAQLVFKDNSLYSTLEKKTENALKLRRSNLKVSEFLDKDFPEASIIIPALLHRDKLKPEDVLFEFNSLKQGIDNRFSGSTDWIHNNFIGCLLQLYAPYSRPCPFFAGFRTFCSLSRGNLRHFLELCYKALLKATDDDGSINESVSPTQQAEAAKQASTEFLGEIRSCGPKGNQLYTFVLRIGSIFALSHRRPSQSEPEQNHFSFAKGEGGLTQEDYDFFNEAIKWSILCESSETKRKDSKHQQTVEYILNPIYSPYFFISYRKKRRLDLKSSEMLTIIRGNLDTFSTLLKRYSKEWSIDTTETQPIPLSLFD